MFGIKEGFNRLNNWWVEFTEGYEITFARMPGLAIAIENHINTIGKDAPNAEELQKLADALRAPLPQTIEELQIIERGYETVLDGIDSDEFDPNSDQGIFLNQRGYHLNHVADHAGRILEKRYGIVSEDTAKSAKRFMGISQENGAAEEVPSHNKLIAYKKAIENSPNVIEDETQETIFKGIEAVEKVSRGKTPSREELEATKLLTNSAHYFAQFWREKDDRPEEKEIIETAQTLQDGGCSSQTTLDYLIEHAFKHLLKYREQEELKESIRMAYFPRIMHG